MSHRTRLLLLALLALAAVFTAVYVWTAPLRAERFLRTASLQDLQAATQQDPNNPRPFYYLGVRLLQLGQPVAAQEALRHAADLDGDDAKSWLGTAIAAAARGEARQGLGIAVTFSQQHPNDARCHLTIAQLWAQLGSAQQAVTEALAATRLDPHNADAWRLAGQEELQLGQPVEAEKDLRQAISQNPRDWRSRLDLGELLLSRGQADESLSCFRQATDLAPAEALPPLLLGRQLLRQAATPDQIEAARRYLLQSDQVQANNAEVNHQLGKCEMRLGHLQAARDALDRARRFAPADLSIVTDLIQVDKQLHEPKNLPQDTARQKQLLAYQNEQHHLLERVKVRPDETGNLLRLARLAASSGDSLQADRAYRELLARAPDQKAARQEWQAVQQHVAEESPMPLTSPEPTVLDSDETAVSILLRDAGALAAQGHADAARSAYLSILARNPHTAAACEGLGRLLDAAGDQDQAISYEEKAVRLEPRLWQAQFALGAYDTGEGFYADAADHYRRGLAVVPNNAAGWHSLGVALAHVPDLYQDAENALGKAVALQPGNVICLRDLADLQSKRHELDQAEASLRRALSLAPQDADTQRDLAAFLIANRPMPAALLEAQRLLQASETAAPGQPMTSYWQGRLALLQGDARRAIDLLLRAASYVHGEDAVQLQYSLSRAYLAAGDSTRAQAAQSWADRTRARNDRITATEFQLSGDPRNVPLRLQLARLYAEGGEFAKATRSYEEVQRQDPNNATARADLAKLAAYENAHDQIGQK